MNAANIHSFHIPVLGLAYTIDSPVKVARYGIHSVVSIIEDKLIELMRKHYYHQYRMPYMPIASTEDDYRARRITDYLDLMGKVVDEQFEQLRQSAFDKGSEIVKYFEMLPEKSVLRQAYERMRLSDDSSERQTLEESLRATIKPGRIDVNIMTKVDKNNFDKDGNPLTESSDALSALRGYANSSLQNSAIIFSAGLNPRLFNYIEKLAGFQARGLGEFDKEIVIKVSDFRSAIIQGKYLAKKGVWVSEFRIESGLNCGGHAFATDGSLLGPILQEFKTKRSELIETLHTMYTAALSGRGIPTYDVPHPVRLTVQGGIGTSEEAEFLASEYGMDSTGWGTPFLLCPEATTVDDETLGLLCKAGETDVLLSKNSPLGIRFNYLKNTSAEKEKMARISNGRPGSPCTEKHLVSNTEFTKEPICTASLMYQKHKISQLKTLGLAAAEFEKQFQEVVSKECLCIGLSNAAIVKYHLPPVKNMKAVTICPGPNIAYFNRIVTLQEMADHIYGRGDILSDPDRPHMFINELKLNINYLSEQLPDLKGADAKRLKDSIDFGKQLLTGIVYYRSVSDRIAESGVFNDQLDILEAEIVSILNSIK